MKKVLFFCFFAVLFILAGCSGDEQAESLEVERLEKNEEEETDQVEKKQSEEIPTAAVDNVHEIVKEIGKYDISEVNKNEDVKEQLLAELKDFPDGLTGEEAYNRVIPLIAANIQEKAEKFEAVDPVIKFDSSTPNSDIDIPDTETINVALLLDASGSMAGHVSGGEKMKLAKDAIKRYAADLPEGSNIMLRVYGHKGTGSDADKDLSCNSHEVVFPLGVYEEETFDAALNKFAPAGWTPLAGAIDAARADFEGQYGENIRNVIYVVSDGVETCGGDPVAAAKSLHDSDIQAEVNIIGFDVNNEGHAELKAVADAGGGTYKSVYTESDLNDYLQQEYSRLYWEWLAWGNDRYFDVLAQSNDIYFEMLGYKNDIYFASLAEKNLLSTLRYELMNLGKFKSNEEAVKFWKLANTRHDSVRTYFNQEEERKNKIRKELKEKYEKLIQEKKKEHMNHYSSS